MDDTASLQRRLKELCLFQATWPMISWQQSPFSQMNDPWSRSTSSCRTLTSIMSWRRFLFVHELLRTFEEKTAVAALRTNATRLVEHLVEFLSEWIVTFVEPAREVTKLRDPELLFLHEKDYWFRAIWQDLHLAATLDRVKSVVCCWPVSLLSFFVVFPVWFSLFLFPLGCSSRFGQASLGLHCVSVRHALCLGGWVGFSRGIVSRFW